MLGNIEKPDTMEIESPDDDRVAKAAKNQSTLTNYMRLYANATERLYSNFARLQTDLKQVNNTLTCIRESFKVMGQMEQKFGKEFDHNT